MSSLSSIFGSSSSSGFEAVVGIGQLIFGTGGSIEYTRAGTEVFTVPADVSKIRVHVLGGGGGGAISIVTDPNDTSIICIFITTIL